MNDERLLVRLPNWVGDGALAAPALRALQSARPDLRLILVGTNRSAPLFGRWPCEAVFSIDRRNSRDTLRLLRTLRGGGIAEALILAPSFRAALLPAMMGIPRRVGWKNDGRAMLLTDRAEQGARTRHLASQYLSLAALLGAKPDTPLDPALPIGNDERESAGRRLAALDGEASKVVALCPGATYGETKRWPLSHWLELAEALLGDGHTLVVLGGRDEAAAGESIAQADGRRILSLAGSLTLRESLALFASIGGAVSNDSGAMHLAAAAGCPVVGLFGSTNPVWTGPLGKRTEALSLALPCSPCYAKECPTRIECLRDLSPRTVHEALRRTAGGVEEANA